MDQKSTGEERGAHLAWLLYTERAICSGFASFIGTHPQRPRCCWPQQRWRRHAVGLSLHRRRGSRGEGRTQMHKAQSERESCSEPHAPRSRPRRRWLPHAATAAAAAAAAGAAAARSAEAARPPSPRDAARCTGPRRGGERSLLNYLKWKLTPQKKPESE